MSQIKIKGSTEIAGYTNPNSVTIRLRLEGLVTPAFMDWFATPINCEWTSALKPQMCRVTSDAIEFQSTEATSKSDVEMVKKWVELASLHAALEAQRQEARDREMEEQGFC